MIPSLRAIPLSAIHFTAANPRSDPETDLAGLAASLGSQEEGRLVQPPILEERGDGTYTIIAGERRIRAAKLAGWSEIACLVRPQTNSIEAHTLRLLENLHRRDLHPLDEAAALKIAWLAANAEALGLRETAAAILAREQTPPQTLAELETALAGAGFVPTQPAIPWDELLDRLGISLDPERRKKLLGVLAVDTGVQEQARQIEGLTEASLRAIGTLPAAEQERLVAEIAGHPELARKARRVARVVRQGDYTLDEALAEAKGQVPAGPEEVETPAADDPFNLFDDRSTEAILQLLEAANQVSVALAAIQAALAGKELAELPPPWGEYAQDALKLIGDELGKFERGG